MKNERDIKVIIRVAKVVVPLCLLSIGSVFAFSPSTKREIIRRQGGKCAVCGRPGNLQCHHIVPQIYGGNDSEANGVALCPSDHMHWDTETLEKGNMYPGKPIWQAPRTQIRNKQYFSIATKLFK